MKKVLLQIFLITSLSCFSQATLIKDINLGNGSSSPKNKITFNGFTYFPANDGVNGFELWRTDGTEAGTTIFKEFVSGEDNGVPYTNFDAFVLNGKLFFPAFEGSNTFLWESDGTEAGTIKVKQFSTNLIFHDVINSQLIFTAENGLWKTDGTEAGTIKLKDFSVFGGNRFIKSGNEIFFSGEESSNVGQELWKTDGTIAGTVLVKDIRSGSSDSFPNNFAELNGIVYFSANNGSNGFELWKSDGTAAGTEMVKDVTSGSGSTFSTNTPIVVYNNKLYFKKSSDLWESDGTETGTVEVKTDLGFIKTMLVLNNKLLIFSYNSTTQKQVIWDSDGTDSGTTSFDTELQEFWHNGEYNIVGNELFFQGNHPATGYEIWKTDGTQAGTILLKDIHPSFDDNNIEDIVELNGNAIFTASDGNWLGKELYISDGTENGTMLLKDINKEGNNSSSPSNFFLYNDHVYFTADSGDKGIELWVTTGSTTTMIKDINIGPGHSNPASFVELNGTIYFKATSLEKGTELWKTDGTETGTVLVKDINPGIENGLVGTSIVAFNGKLYFYANDGANGAEIWESDGTEAGTVMLKDINSGTDSSMRSGEIIVFKNNLYFNANDNTNGFELWKSDGTEAGTNLFYDANTSSSGSPDNFIIFKEGLYFRASSTSGSKLFRTDGSSTSTLTDKGYNNMTVSGDYMYFVSTYSNGGELWATQNGVTVYQVKDIRPGSGGSNGSFPSVLTDVNGTLFFKANDGTHGNELWKSDGTNAGTILVKDIVSGSSSSQITNIVSFGGFAFFNAPQDPVNSSNNYELWKSDGTESGTELYQDINPTSDQFQGGSNLNNFYVANAKMYFSANNGSVGNELFKLEESALSLKKENLLQEKKISLFPNPISDILNLDVHNQTIKSVKVFNLLGKQVFYNKGIDIKSINISMLPKGIYILKAKTDELSFSKKIIKN